MNNLAAERVSRLAIKEGKSGDGTIPAQEAPLNESQREVAQYVADMILELRNMAKSAKLTRVMVPLEFAYYEAFNIANAVKIPPEEIERLKTLSEAAREFEHQSA